VPVVVLVIGGRLVVVDGNTGVAAPALWAGDVVVLEDGGTTAPPLRGNDRSVCDESSMLSLLPDLVAA
jgi:hypothetical protein